MEICGMSMKQKLTQLLGLSNPTQQIENCPHCGEVMQSREIGFFPPIILVLACAIGFGLVGTYFWAILFGNAHAPTGAGGGKFIVFLPIFIGALIFKIKKNLRRKVLFCEKCDK
jgi:hypothetical protein